MSALVNLAFGAYMTSGVPRPRLRAIGSALVLGTPVLMLAAFVTEPRTGELDRNFTGPAVILFGLGTLCACLAAKPVRRPEDLRTKAAGSA